MKLTVDMVFTVQWGGGQDLDNHCYHDDDDDEAQAMEALQATIPRGCVTLVWAYV